MTGNEETVGKEGSRKEGGEGGGEGVGGGKD